MPLGESGGSVRIPRLGVVNPANPCSDNELSDCKRLGAETVNGYATEKWEYTNRDGERITAWIATKLRFPIRTVADNGATTEIANVVEGPQAASLFELPGGYSKVDDVGGDDAAALPNIDPATLQRAMKAASAMAAAMEATGATAAGNAGRGGAAPKSAGGSAWEGGPGYVVNVTITAKGTTQVQNSDGTSRSQSTNSARYVASIPLNYGAPGVPPMIGPQWSLLALAGSGSPEAEAQPLTVAFDSRVDKVDQQSSGCGLEQERSTTNTVITQKGQVATSIAKKASQIGGSAIWQLNPTLTSYALTVQLVVMGGQADEVRNSKKIDHCAGERATTDTHNAKVEFGGLAFEVKDVPLPAGPGAIKGSKTIPWTYVPGTETATVEWNIVRMGAR